MNSFRLKIVLWYTAIVVMTLIIIRLITIEVVRNSLYADLDDSLIGEAQWVRNIIDSYKARQISDEEICNEIIERGGLNPRKEFIDIYDGRGLAYFRSLNLQGSDTLKGLGASVSGRPLTISDFRGHRLRLISLRDSEYEVYVGFPLTDIDAAVDEIISSFLLPIPVAIILVLAGGMLLIHRFVKPVKDLHTYAENLMRQPLDKDLPAMKINTKDEIGRLVEQIYAMVRQMRASMKQALGFSALASHELRTPLSVVRNELEQALKENTREKDLRRTLASTYDEMLRMSRTVDDLLSLGTMQAGTFTLQRSSVNLHHVLKEFYDEALLLCRPKNISVVLERVPDIIISLDYERIRQVLFNMLDNSLKHTPAGGRISLECTVEVGTVLLKFADSGEGIPLEDLPYIFDPFRRVVTDESRRTNGTGLGLALVRLIVETHGGTVSVQSEKGKGTILLIALPQVASSPVRTP